jgi:hypothetical protein
MTSQSRPLLPRLLLRAFSLGCRSVCGRWLVVAAVCWGLAGVASAQLRLTEIQVVNTAGLQDEDATAQPWVEIWNASQTAKASLNNQKLTDGTTTWTFPLVEIMPDEHMIVWLSGKNRRVATTPLHTDFTPAAGGGSISLLNATNVLVSALNYPAQTANVSWGRDASDTAVTPTLTGFYAAPTPNEPNSFDGDGVASRVTFSHASQAFTGTLEVVLTPVAAAAGAEIRYTTNRSLPGEASTLYTGPITVSATTMIRARVFVPGKLPGETNSQSFLLLNANAATFSSAIPIIVVTNFLTSQPPNDGDQASFMWVWEPAAPDNRARFTNPPTIASRTVIDKRGSSTLGNAKFNLNLETRNPWNEEQQQYALLGMPEESDWVLHAPYDFDRSLIHNPLAYALSNALGRYASRTRQAEVFMEVTGSSLNFPGTTSGDYFGVYNVMEKVRRNNDRVDIRKLEKYENDDVSKTGGWIWKVDRLDPGDSGFSAGGQSFAYYYPKEIEVKSPQRDPQEQFLAKNTNPTATNPLPAGYIKQFNDALQKPTFTDPVLGYAPYFDVPPAIDHHLHNVWTFNVDALRLSGYWTKERGAKMYPGPVWDFDRALCSTDGRDLDPKTWRSKTSDQGTDFFNFTWWNRLFRDPDFYQKYIDRWQALRRPGQPFSAPVVNALIDSLNAQTGDEAVTRDYTRWRQAKRAWTSPFTGTVYPAPTSNPVQGQAAEIQRIKDWMQQRADFFDTQWVGAVTASLPDGNVPAGTQVTLTGPVGATIYYTINGEDPRPRGGAVAAGNVPALSPGVRIYDGPITVSSTARIRARAFKPTHTALTGANNPPLVSKWGGLLNVRFATDPPAAAGSLVVSEIHYNPAAPTAAELAVNPLWESGDFEFVELHNPGATPVDLFGVAVADAVTYSITGEAALSLPPGGSVIIADDPAAISARYGSALGPVLGGYSGNLSNGGELLSLLGAGGGGIFSMTYTDTWHPSTDGGGASLVVYDPQASPAAFSEGANWRASAATGGSPGAYDPRSAPRPDGGAAPAGPFTSLPLSGVLGGGLGGSADPTTLWSLVDGPGTATIAPATAMAATATFSKAGAYTLRLTATDGLLTRSDDVVVYAQETPTSWLASYPEIGTLEDDAEGDGRSNFMEYALQTSPTAPQAGEPPEVTMDEGRMALTFTRLSPPSAVNYAVQISPDMITWRLPNPGEVIEEILATDGFTQTVRITDTVAVTAGMPRYLRLRMTAAP